MSASSKGGVLACLLVLPWPALGWSDVGHRIICEITVRELNDTARERVKAMIRMDPEFDTFAEACSWADHPRRRAEEHYVNLPRGAPGFIKDPCPLANKCVVRAIKADLAVLASSSAAGTSTVVKSRSGDEIVAGPRFSSMLEPTISAWSCAA